MMISGDVQVNKFAYRGQGAKVTTFAWNDPFSSSNQVTLTKTSESLHLSHILHIMYLKLWGWRHSRRDSLIIQNFASSLVRERLSKPIKILPRFLLHKINKNMQIYPGQKYFAQSRVWRHLVSNLKLCNFVTWKLIETLQNFVHCSFCVELTKIYHKNTGKFLALGNL